jgi:hypothetical protein
MIYEVVNMIYNNFAFLADADTAGVVVDARVPIVLTSAGRILPRRAACRPLPRCFTRTRWRALRTAC